MTGRRGVGFVVTGVISVVASSAVCGPLRRCAVGETRSCSMGVTKHAEVASATTVVTSRTSRVRTDLLDELTVTTFESSLRHQRAHFGQPKLT